MIPPFPPLADAGDPRVTVCHPVWRLERGGLERQMLEVIRRLSGPEFRHVIVVRGGRDATSEPFGRNVTIIDEPAVGRDAVWSRRLACRLRGEAVDVMHLRGLSMLLDGLAAAELCGEVGVAFSFHGFEHTERRWSALRRAAWRGAVMRCPARWAVSRAAAEALSEELDLPGASLDVIPNGVDTDRFSPAADREMIRRALGLPADRRIVLSVGNLKPIKGHDVLLHAVERLAGGFEQATLVLVGEDHLGGRLQAWAAAHLPGQDVRFLGGQAEVLPWYQAADVFVLPSRWEGASNALLEAMACGLPVIAAAVGGNREILRDGETGLLAGDGSAAELAGAMERLLGDAGLRRGLGRAARAEAIRSRSAAVTAARHGGRYMSLAREGRHEAAACAGAWS
jgi:glycosyltransferase involved in cell wall biosynthesis